MPSPALLRGRFSAIGCFYVVTAVTAGRRRIFADTRHAATLMDGLRDSDRRGLTRSFAWVVMPDHLHWVMQLRQGTLGRCMQSLKSRVAIAVNVHSDEGRPVWQRGYYDHLIRNEADVRQQSLYVLAQPRARGHDTAAGRLSACVVSLAAGMRRRQSSKLDSTGGVHILRHAPSMTYPSRPLALAWYNAVSAPSTK
ncbi:REP-associated tyrosine transposase [Stenotrophomonas maltophilia]|nr:transposase [Stenotrophomonas maltophilia]